MLIEVAATFIDLLVLCFNFLLLSRVILSWFLTTENAIYRWLVEITEPLLGPVRRLLPKTGGLDLAPLVTFFLLQGIQVGAHYLLAHLA